MFKHILLPTDGTPLSESAVRKGIALAHDHGARVTGVHVSPQFHLLTYRTDMLEETRDEYERDSRAHAERYLKFICRRGARAGCRLPDAARDERRRLGDAARSGAQPRLRPDRDGLARAPRPERRAARQRDAARPDALGRAGARLALKRSA